MVHQIANLILQITKPIKMNMMIKSMVKMVIKLMKMHISSPSQTMSKSKTRVEKKLRTKRWCRSLSNYLIRIQIKMWDQLKHK